MGEGAKLRQTARLILLDEQSRVLLFQFQDETMIDPKSPMVRPFWVTPGGGLEPGETYEAAAQRELWEETGIQGVHLGPWVWTREKELDWAGQPTLFHEHYFVAYAPATGVSLDHLTPLEQRVYQSHRWWSAEDIRASNEVFFPQGLGDLLRPIIAGNLPPRPLELHA